MSEFTPEEVAERAAIESAFGEVFNTPESRRAYMALGDAEQKQIWYMFVHGYIKGRAAR